MGGHDILIGALGCLALKVRCGWHFPICSFAWAAMWSQKNHSHMRSSMHFRPRWSTSLWHPFRATCWCAASKTSWKRVSSDSLGLACLYRTPCLSRRWFHSYRNWLTLHGSVCLDCHHPKVHPPAGLGTSLSRSYKQPADCPGLCPECANHNCRPLWDLWGLWGQPLAYLALLQLWPWDEYLSC